MLEWVKKEGNEMKMVSGGVKVEEWWEGSEVMEWETGSYGVGEEREVYLSGRL